MVAFIYPPSLITSIKPTSAGSGNNPELLGTWDADTNTPTLTSSVGVENTYYLVTVAGNTSLDGITDWDVGDWALFLNGVWNKSDNSNLWVGNGSTVYPKNGEDVDVKTGKFIAGSNTEISEVAGDTVIENTSATNDIIKKLGDSAGATSEQVKNALGQIILQMLSDGTLLVGNQTTPTDGVIENKNASGIIKNKINSGGDQFFNGGNVAFGGTTPNTQFHNFGGTTRNVTTINAATYTVLITDEDLSVTYTTSGSCAVTIPSAQNYKGRKLTIADDGDNSSVNNITILDDGVPTLLATISGDGDSIDIIYNGTSWRLR